MRKIFLILVITFLFQPAYAEKSEWTYAFYIESGKADLDKICNSFKIQNTNYISIYYNNTITDCSNTKKIPFSAKDFFSFVKDSKDSWKYLFAISSNKMDAEGVVGAIGLLRPTLLILDISNMGRLENLYKLNDTSMYISVFADERLKENFDYTSFISSPYNNPNQAEAAAVHTIQKQAETHGNNIVFFTLETGNRFEGFLELYDTRAKCFDKKIERFERIKAVKGQYTDAMNALNIINRMLSSKLKPLIKSSFSSEKGISGPLLYYPTDKTEFDKTKFDYAKTDLHKKYPNWLQFLEILHVK